MQGELQEENQKNELILDEDEYIKRIELKTASLISCSCKLGGIISGLSEDQIYYLDRYGNYLGIIYQIIDDILDYVSDSKQLGKPVNKDLNQGILTLPLIYALKEKFNFKDGESLDSSVLIDFIKSDNSYKLDDSAFEYAYNKIITYSILAKKELTYFHDSATINYLRCLVDSLIKKVESENIDLNIS